MLSVADIC